MSSSAIPTIGVHYSVPRYRTGWELSEETMPESVAHDEAVALLKAILATCAARTGGMQVVRTRELWIFDPLLSGPAAHGGPFRLQIWRRRDNGDWARTFAGDGAAHSPVLGAYVVPVDEGRKLRVADDANATQFWLTAEEAERLAKEAERSAKD